MFRQAMPRDKTDRYMTDEALARDPRAARTNAVEQALVRQYVQALPPGATVVDAPCGNGRMSTLITQRGDLKLVALDYNFTMLQSMAVRDEPGGQPAGQLGGQLLARRLQGDILHLPLPPKCVDLFLNVRLMHHIPDRATQVAMFREIARVARGPVITSFWTTHCWRHVRKRMLAKPIKLYPVSPAHFREVCAEAGLTVERLVPVRRWIDKLTLAVCAVK